MQHKFERPIWLIVVANITKAFSHYLRNNWWYIQMVTIVTVTLIIRGIDRKIRAGKSCKNAIKYFLDRLSLKKLFTVGLHFWLHTNRRLPGRFPINFIAPFNSCSFPLYLPHTSWFTYISRKAHTNKNWKYPKIWFSLPDTEVKSHNFFPSHDTLFPFSFQADVMKHV